MHTIHYTHWHTLAIRLSNELENTWRTLRKEIFVEEIFAEFDFVVFEPIHENKFREKRQIGSSAKFDQFWKETFAERKTRKKNISPNTLWTSYATPILN